MDCNKSSPCDTSFDCVVTELPNIFELDGKIIDDIHAIYKSKRCGSKNKNRKGRKWSPLAACLIASLMTKVQGVLYHVCTELPELSLFRFFLIQYRPKSSS